MDPLAVITAAGSGLGGTIIGGGIVWKLINRWMDGMEDKVCKIFDTLDLTVKKADCQIDRDVCNKNISDRRAERGTRIDRIEAKLNDTREEMGEIRVKVKVFIPELERRRAER
jgi:hypothetical protein